MSNPAPGLPLDEAAVLYPSCRYCNEGLIRSETAVRICHNCNTRTVSEAQALTAKIRDERRAQGRDMPEKTPTEDSSAVDNYPWFSA